MPISPLERRKIVNRRGAADLMRDSRFLYKLAEWRMSWIEMARPKQLTPLGAWDNWLVIAGRGFGKTRIGSEETGYLAAANKAWRLAVVSPTQNDCRSVCFEGKAGLLNIIPEYFIDDFNRSQLELRLINGSLLAGKSAEKPDRLRGPEWNGAWCDELAAWGATAGAVSKKKENERLQQTWDNLTFGLRLGQKPRRLITTTPRPLQFLRDLIKNKRSITRRGSTFENEANLAPSALEAFREVYEGTRIGAQELHAEILDDVEGVLFTRQMLADAEEKDHPELVRIAVAVDPAITAEDTSDEWGIVIGGICEDGDVWVIDDWSGTYTPREAARMVLTAYDRYEADLVIAEVNQGGDLVEAILRSESSDFAYRAVRAKRGKYLRAEPVAAYYEQGRVKHVGDLRTLESQMVEFTGSTSDDSPDRLDALVYLVTELMSGKFKHDFF